MALAQLEAELAARLAVFRGAAGPEAAAKAAAGEMGAMAAKRRERHLAQRHQLLTESHLWRLLQVRCDAFLLAHAADLLRTHAQSDGYAFHMSAITTGVVIRVHMLYSRFNLLLRFLYAGDAADGDDLAGWLLAGPGDHAAAHHRGRRRRASRIQPSGRQHRHRAGERMALSTRSAH